MVVNRVPLCRWCGVRIYWNIRVGVWMHRRGVEHCRAYRDTIAEPTVFVPAGGEEL